METTDVNPADSHASVPSTPGPATAAPTPARRAAMSWRPLGFLFLLSGVFFLLFVGASYFLFTRNLGRAGQGGGGQAGLFGGEGVGILEVNGVIMDSKKTLKSIRRFSESPDVKALVIRINSPGGAVAPSQEIYSALKRFPKPKVASMSSVAASGGYYVAVAADRIFANPGTITGSIGVIMEFANLERLYDWAKIKRFSIKTGRYKDAGAEYREMLPDERALLQGMVDDVLLQFKLAVAEGRKLSLEEVTPLADGRVFSGHQARAARLVDELGGIDEAVAAAAKLGGISGKPRLILEEKKKRGILEVLGQLRDGDDEEVLSDDVAQSRGANRLVAEVQKALGLQKAATFLEPGVYWIWKGAM